MDYLLNLLLALEICWTRASLRWWQLTSRRSCIVFGGKEEAINLSLLLFLLHLSSSISILRHLSSSMRTFKAMMTATPSPPTRTIKATPRWSMSAWKSRSRAFHSGWYFLKEYDRKYYISTVFAKACSIFLVPFPKTAERNEIHVTSETVSEKKRETKEEIMHHWTHSESPKYANVQEEESRRKEEGKIM